MNINKVNLRVNGTLSGTNNPNKIIIHHPVFNGSIEALNEMMITMGYTMIGYNFYVRKDGTVWEGRPCNVQGANCTGQNSQSIGVCCEGNFDVDIMGDAQYNALVELCKYLMDKYKISEVGPHSKYLATGCPGKNFPIDRVLKDVVGGGTVTGNTVQVDTVDQYNNLAYATTAANKYGVLAIQKRLIQLGFSCGSAGADGIFGKATYDAVKAFQKANGLTVDGIVGENTYKALFKNNSSTGQSTVAPNTGNIIKELQKILISYGEKLVYGADGLIGNETITTTCKYTIKQGSNKTALNKWLQQRLIQLGFSCGSAGADGIFGKGTTNAVVAFQRANGLTADGIVGPNTWKKIFQKIS